MASRAMSNRKSSTAADWRIGLRLNLGGAEELIASKFILERIRPPEADAHDCQWTES